MKGNFGSLIYGALCSVNLEFGDFNWSVGGGGY